jgi:hypothetical protein
MSDKTIRFLIQQKMSYVNSAVNICMLWWASSIVFSGSILAAVWTKRGELGPPVNVILLGLAIFIFFFGVADFGFLAANRLGMVQKQIAELASKLDYGESEREENFFHTEIKTFQISMILGGGSFALICVVWSAFWFYLVGLPWLFLCIGSILIWGWLWVCLFRKRLLKKWLNDEEAKKKEPQPSGSSNCTIT